MGLKVRTFALVLDRPAAVYRASEVVSGQCVLALDGDMHLSQLTITLKGEAECEWTEQKTVAAHQSHGNHGSDHNHHHHDHNQTRTETVRHHAKHTHNHHHHDHNQTRTETVRHHAKHTCVDLVYCPGNVYPSTLSGGQHNIGFNFQLPLGALPSSFESTYGHIRYWIEAHIRKTAFFAFDERTRLPLQIRAPALASPQELAMPAVNSAQKTVGLFGGQPLSLRAEIARTGHAVGSTLQITCFVDNRSKKAMQLMATLRQEVDFFANGSKRRSDEKIAKSMGPTVGAHTVATEVILLPIPLTAAVVYNSCPIIRAKHVLDVFLSISGSFDLHVILGIILTND
ncbi:unnamed protein product [Oppiella nova]|uniref:Arrestin C-terminal-like domain-containing protein n=1 Tax=Oppiella nova TaxID=334625 RepID=A0A7R9LTB3_9ACAR|nr:unnamed protein product [Oppiella nova]CAG2166783.1 unnamed protein product [Oppiella nova]